MKMKGRQISKECKDALHTSAFLREDFVRKAYLIAWSTETIV